MLRSRRSGEDGSDQDALAPTADRATQALLDLAPGPVPGHEVRHSLNYFFSAADDLPSYLFQVSRLLQNGSIGQDPFSCRQLLSLNGQTFLLGLLGAGAPLQFSYLLDPGICWLILGGLTWSLLRRDLRVSPA